MRIEIIMPKMGESIQEGKILHWTKRIGERIEKEETLLEISTDKVDSEIPSPAAGVLVEIRAKENDVVPVGAVIAIVETGLVPENTALQESVINFNVGNQSPEVSVHISGETNKSNREEKSGRFYSPLVRKIAEKEKISNQELDAIVGTGTNGRVSKKDILAYCKQKEMLLQSVGRKEKSFFLQSVPIEEVLAKYPEPLHRIVPLDHVQLKMAEHMSRSAATSPHVTIVDEADVSLLILLYRKLSDGFEKKHGFKLTLTPFFAFAVVRALKEFPLLNSSLAGDKVIFKKNINLGIAVASPAGLLVPVIKYADEKNFLGLAQAIHDLTYRTRAKKLLPEDISGGTFSLTNYGVFGNIIGTPIINQPQAAIFGIGAVKKRPVVVENEGNDSIEIRSMLYLTLSFDHRFIDGATGGQFTARVRQVLEQMTENEVQ